MSKFEEYQAVVESLADCSVCGHDRADIIESGEAFHVECFACGERTGEHESYQCAAKEWSEGMNIKQSIELTKAFNQWRRGETDETLTMDDLGLDPEKIGEALDTLVNFAEVTVMTQEFLAGEAVNFSSLSDDKE